MDGVAVAMVDRIVSVMQRIQTTALREIMTC